MASSSNSSTTQGRAGNKIIVPFFLFLPFFSILHAQSTPPFDTSEISEGRPFEKLLVSLYRSLSFIPFEMITLADHNRPRAKLRNAPISYNYNLMSIAPLALNRITTTYAYAPTYQMIFDIAYNFDLDLVSRLGLFNLPGAQEEAQTLARLYSGKAIVGSF